MDEGTVTVEICGQTFTRKVKYSARKYADLYVTVNGHAVTLEEFQNAEAFKDNDYSYIVRKEG